jgi:uncharacterized DUF497 family protein
LREERQERAGARARFRRGCALFESPLLEWQDRRHGYGEVRFSALGQIEGRVFFVSFTHRADAIRIIVPKSDHARNQKVSSVSRTRRPERHPLIGPELTKPPKARSSAMLAKIGRECRPIANGGER